MPTTKVTTEFHSVPFTVGEVGNDTGAPPPTVTSNTRVSVTKSATGDPVPNFRRRIRLMQDATGLYTTTANDFHFDGGKILARWKRTHGVGSRYWVSEAHGLLVPGAAPANDVNTSGSDANNKARTEFYARSIKAQRKIMSGVVAGEMAKAMKMVRQPGKALWNALGAHSRNARKRMRNANPKTKRRIASELWLEGVYGWRPLISDVKGGAEAIAHILHGQPAAYCSGFGVYQGPIVEAIQTDIKASVQVSTAYKQHDTHTVKFRGNVALQGNQVAPSAMKALGMTWADVPLTLWELLPFSFLVDYFTGIGNVIDAASHGYVNLTWGNCADVQRREVTRITVSFTPLEFFQFTVEYCNTTPCSTSSKYTRFTRTVVNTVPFPSIQWRLPHGLQWLNLAALSQVCRI